MRHPLASQPQPLFDRGVTSTCSHVLFWGLKELHAHSIVRQEAKDAISMGCT